MEEQHAINDRLVWMLKVSREMLATRDLAQLLTLITDAFVEACEAERGFLLLADETQQLQARIGRSATGQVLDISKMRISSICQQVFEQQKSLFATDTGQVEELASHQSIDELNLKMLVCVPLKLEQRALGVFYADGPTTLSSVFTISNRRAIETLAEHAAAAIDNAHFHQKALHHAQGGTL